MDGLAVLMPGPVVGSITSTARSGLALMAGPVVWPISSTLKYGLSPQAWSSSVDQAQILQGID